MIVIEKGSLLLFYLVCGFVLVAADVLLLVVIVVHQPNDVVTLMSHFKIINYKNVMLKIGLFGLYYIIF